MQFTQREFLFLDDLLHYEEHQVKKYRHYWQQCQDPRLKQLLAWGTQVHQRHFSTLLQYLNQAQSQAQGFIPPQPEQTWSTQQPFLYGIAQQPGQPYPERIGGR